MGKATIDRRLPREGEYYWLVDRRRMLRAEIDGAISAFFEGNNIASRVLTWAAIDVLRTLLKQAKIDSFHGAIEDWIKTEFVSSWRSILRSDYNFFKHADRDADGVIEDYRPEMTAYDLLGAVSDYGSLYRSQTLRMAMFKTWIFGRYPNILKQEALSQLGNAIRALPSAADPNFEQSLVGARDLLRHLAENQAALVQIFPAEVRSAFEDFKDAPAL